MHPEILLQIAIAIVVATAAGYLANLLRQPLILGYIAAGVLAGHTEGLGWISTRDIEPVSQLGLILLLFMIGLEIDLRKLAKAGGAIAAAGVGQFIICVALGLIVFSHIGVGFAASGLAPLYLAVGAALSSTTIVVKLLYDKYEIDTTAGRLSLGILVFQDLWAILFLALQPELRNPAPLVLVTSLAKGATVVAVSLVTSRYVLPLAFRRIAKRPELMVLGALAWCFAVVLLSSWLRLSKEMGALIAGVALSTFPYNLDVIAKVISLRDFFVTLFFVSLGTRIERPSAEVMLLATAGAAFLIVSRFLSITPILAGVGRGARVSFVTALNLSQISEFSLVICTLGVALGHIPPEVLAAVVMMLVITSVTSTYAIHHNHRIFLALEPLLGRLGLRDGALARATGAHAIVHPIVFLGFARTASSLLEELLQRDPSLAEQIAVVDFNPDTETGLARRGVRRIYGDISHSDTLERANVGAAQVVISTVPDAVLKGTSNLRVLRMVRALAPDAAVICTATGFEMARELYEEGATYVLMNRVAGARELTDVVLSALEGHGAVPREAGVSFLAERAEVLP